jgi:hypothetical protein
VLKQVEEEVEEPKGRPKWKAGVLKPMEEPEPPKPRIKIWKGALKRVDKEEKDKTTKKIPEIWGSKAKCFICVDVFSKKVFCMAVDGTTAPDATKGMMGAVQELGPPKEVFTDDGAEFKGDFKVYLEGQNIRHIVTRNHAMFAERFIRYLRWTLKDMQKTHNEDWVNLLPDVVRNYNKRKHDTTKLSPNESSKDENSLETKLNIVMQAKRDRKYPPLTEGDRVKLYQKKSRHDKETVPVWSEAVFTVDEVDYFEGHEEYKLEPQPKGLKTWYLRHELLKV